MSHGIVKKVNGVSDIVNHDKTCWFIVHSPNKLIFHGQHVGQISTLQEIECLATEDEMLSRIAALGFEIETDEE